MDNTLCFNEHLMRRIKQNYEDFKMDMLLLDGEDMYAMAHKIAAVEDAYDWMSIPYFLDEEDSEYLLRFYNPLEMLADCIEGQQICDDDEIHEALNELFAQEDNEENYITAALARELMLKYGSDVSIKLALLTETIEAGQRYIGLLKLSDDIDSTLCAGCFCGCEGVDV